jgi:hypothetical protein
MINESLGKGFEEMLREYKVFKAARMTEVYLSRANITASGIRTKWSYSVMIGENVWTKDFATEDLAKKDRERFMEAVETCKNGPQLRRS